MYLPKMTFLFLFLSLKHYLIVSLLSLCSTPASMSFRAGGGSSLMMNAVVGSNTANVGRPSIALMPSSLTFSR